MDITSRKFKGSYDFLRNSPEQAGTAPTIVTVDGLQAEGVVGAAEPVSAEFAPEAILTGLASHGKMEPAAISEMIGAKLDVTGPLLDEFVANNFIENIGGSDTPEFQLTSVGQRAVRYSKMVK